LEPFRYREQPALPHNETVAMFFVCLDEMRFQAQASRECYGLRLFGDEGIRTVLHEESVAMFSLNNSSKSGAGFEKEQFKLQPAARAVLDKPVCGC
jgi:hypothetical protein